MTPSAPARIGSRILVAAQNNLASNWLVETMHSPRRTPPCQISTTCPLQLKCKEAPGALAKTCGLGGSQRRRNHFRARYGSGGSPPFQFLAQITNINFQNIAFAAEIVSPYTVEDHIAVNTCRGWRRNNSNNSYSSPSTRPRDRRGRPAESRYRGKVCKPQHRCPARLRPAK